MSTDQQRNGSLRRVVIGVAICNLAYFGFEFAVARSIGSVSLFADSVDFLEDASLNFLIALSLSWTSGNRAKVGMVLALLLLVPGVATLWTAWEKLATSIPPQPIPLTLTGAGALVVNFGCAFVLARHRHLGGSLTKAAFLSARNDAVANIAIIAAGLVTAFVWHSVWPDLITGLAVAAMNADAARDVWLAARAEQSLS